MRRLITFYDHLRAGSLRIGKFVLTTQAQINANGRNAFEIGRDYERLQNPDGSRR